MLEQSSISDFSIVGVASESGEREMRIDGRYIKPTESPLKDVERRRGIQDEPRVECRSGALASMWASTQWTVAHVARTAPAKPDSNSWRCRRSAVLDRCQRLLPLSCLTSPAGAIVASFD